MTWDLRFGDCLDAVGGLASLADGSVDVTITDPPYAAGVKGYRAPRSKWKGGICGRAAFGFDPMEDEILAQASREIARVTRRWALVFSDVESCAAWRLALTAAGMKYIRTGAWLKGAGAPQFTGDRPAVGFEAITICHGPGRLRWNGGGSAGLWQERIVTGDAIEKRLHTTQKPIALMEKLARLFSEPGELVLDPFAGSGTTGAAALRLGRRFLGWERDEKYHRIASRRLAGTREQIELPVSSMKQERLLP